MSDLTNPPITLLCKLASIAVHAEEFLSDDGHHVDRDALVSGLADPEVTAWLTAMSGASLAPRKRRP